MSALLSSGFDTGGSDFTTESASGGTVVSPNTANVVLTPPEGKRVKLSHLSTSGANEQSSVTVDIGGNVVFSAKTLSGETPLAPNKFSVGSFQAYPAGTPPSGNHRHLIGGVDEVITISTPGAVSVTIYYAYEFGE